MAPAVVEPLISRTRWICSSAPAVVQARCSPSCGTTSTSRQFRSSSTFSGRWRRLKTGSGQFRTKRRTVSVAGSSFPPSLAKMLLRRRVEAFSELVFPSTTATPRIPDNFRLQWHAALKGTRFEGRVPKEFRATVAAAIRDAAGLERAQHQLGHSSYSTTEQSYLPPVIEVPDSTAILERFNVRATLEVRYPNDNPTLST